MRQLRRAMCLILGLMSLVAFAPSDGLASATALLRVVHASPDAPTVAVHLDGQPIFGALSFTVASDYASVLAGTHRLQVFAAGANGGGKMFIDSSVDLRPGEAYTVVAADTLAKMVPIVISDGLVAPPADQSSVRLFHASPDAPGIADVAVAGGGPVVFKNVAFKADTPYLAVPPGTYSFDIRPAGTTQAVATTPAIALAGGATYTVFAMGFLSDKSFQAIIIPDRAVSGGVGTMPSSGGGGAAPASQPAMFAILLLAVAALAASYGSRWSAMSARRTRADK